MNTPQSIFRALARQLRTGDASTAEFAQGWHGAIRELTAKGAELPDRFVAAGIWSIKFLTDGVYDTPPDYGWDDTVTFDVPGSGSVRPVSGPGTNIRISVANSGTYRFILDEQLQRWEIQLVTPAPEVVR